MGHNPFWISRLRWRLNPNQTWWPPTFNVTAGSQIRAQCVADLGSGRRETSGSNGNNVGLRGAPEASLLRFYAWLSFDGEINWTPPSSFGCFRVGRVRGQESSRKLLSCLRYGSVRRNSGNFGKGRKLHHCILCPCAGLWIQLGRLGFLLQTKITRQRAKRGLPK